MNVSEVSRQEILRKVQEVLVSGFELRDDQVLPTARVVDDLELDSLDRVDLVVRLEQEVDLEIEEGELKAIETVQDIVDVIYRKLSARAA
jgi:acyl carrier protein